MLVQVNVKRIGKLFTKKSTARRPQPHAVLPCVENIRINSQHSFYIG